MSDGKIEVSGISYYDFVKALKKNPAQLLVEYTAFKADLDHMVMGLAGEVGELVDAIKQHTKYDKGLDCENVVEELGDIEFYLEGLRQAIGVRRFETIEKNKEKLAKRYASLHYSNEAAALRADKQKGVPENGMIIGQSGISVFKGSKEVLHFPSNTGEQKDGN